MPNKKQTKPTHDHCRPPLERMFHIHTELQKHSFPNCSSLARGFELSPRTLARDIDFMRDRLHLPIEWNTLKNGYYYTRPVKHFPLLAINEAETFALLVAHKAIAQYHGTPFQKPLAAAFHKLTGQLDQNPHFSLDNLDQVVSFRPFAPDDADLKIFEVLTRSLRRRRVLEIHYRNRAAPTAQERRIHPYHITCIQDRWYLLAFDLMRQDIRTFVLPRIQKATLGAGTFKIPKDFNADAYLDGSFGVFKSPSDGDYQVEIDFDAWAADEVRDRHWHVPSNTTKLPNGALRLRLRLANLEEVERWILSFGPHATVVGPQALLDRLARTAEIFRARYGKPDAHPTQPGLDICAGCLGRAKGT